MVLEEQLKFIIEGQNSANIKKINIPRNISLPEKTNRIIVISGIRRCGKSTLLRQLIGSKTDSLCINFEDPRLDNFELNDFYKIEKIANEIGKTTFVFDEIQNIEGWEKYVRSANENGRSIYITGSNASMLSKELGTRLTGRYIQLELFPFDYLEYLLFTKRMADADSYKDYILNGGFPEFLKEQNPEYLRTLLKDIIARDIVIRRGIKNEHTLIQLAVYLLTNIAKEFSYNNITKSLSIKSVRSTIDYCDYLQESYVLEFVPRFSFSLKQQQINPKKIYCIDTGMAKANSLSFNDDLGRMLENSVYLQLRKKTKDIQYFKDEKSECDFLVWIENKMIAVQVCWQLTPDNLEREMNGLKRAMQATNTENGLIITFNQADQFGNIRVIPIWEWKI